MDKEELIDKIENMYIMLLYAISKEDLDRVKQYLSDEQYIKYENIINNNIKNNVVQKYGELNVASLDIVSIQENLVTVEIVVKYIDYKIDRITRKFKEGSSVKEKYNFRLKVRYNECNRELVYRCENCGAPLNVNLTGVCDYCKVPVDEKESLYVIESIE